MEAMLHHLFQTKERQGNIEGECGWVILKGGCRLIALNGLMVLSTSVVELTPAGVGEGTVRSKQLRLAAIGLGKLVLSEAD